MRISFMNFTSICTYTQDEITRFVLKGPYQDKENFYIKSGLLIDSSSQIVYKIQIKDIRI